MNHDLTTEEGRENAIKELHQKFIEKLKSAGVTIPKDAFCEIESSSIDIFFNDFKTTPLSLYKSKEDEITINFGVGSSFSPKNTSKTNKIITAASILSNWGKVSPLVKLYIKKYNETVDMIFKLNSSI